MSNIKVIPATGTDPVKFDTTPLAGGHGREAKANLGSNVGVSTGVLLQGHNGIDAGHLPSGAVPPSDDDGWFDLLTAPQTGPVVEIEDLPLFVRKGDATLSGPISIEGVQ